VTKEQQEYLSEAISEAIEATKSLAKNRESFHLDYAAKALKTLIEIQILVNR